MNPNPIHRLDELRQACRNMIVNLSDADCRHQPHPMLSPLGWHVGHVTFVESYWLQEVVCGDDSNTACWHKLFFPQNVPKEVRQNKLPPQSELLDWTDAMQACNQAYWQHANSEHPLMQNNYLAWFVIQHYSQHLETMHMVRDQTQLSSARVAGTAKAVLTPQAVDSRNISMPPATDTIGTDNRTLAYDNERPAHTKDIAGFKIARHPVSNGQWLAFMQDGGYQRENLWSPAGQRWLVHTGVTYPQHWRPHPADGWYCPIVGQSLKNDAPVYGICWHEANAYARWAGARLPHEYEYEHARHFGVLADTGRVWEWCANSLHPYPGYTAFPYTRYSQPWFDGQHRVLRGGSAHTAAEIKRPGFRNFYLAGHRHIYAGVRLAWD